MCDKNTTISIMVLSDFRLTPEMLIISIQIIRFYAKFMKKVVVLICDFYYQFSACSKSDPVKDQGI